MNKSHSLRRIIILVVMSVLLFAFVTLGVYSAVSPRIFAQAKLNELRPRALFLAEQAQAYFDPSMAQLTQQRMQFFSMNAEQWGATVYLLDANRNVVANNQEIAQSVMALNVSGFDELIEQVLAGKELTLLSYRTDSSTTFSRDLLFVGAPVYVDEAVVGAVIMIKPLEEVTSAMSSLTSTLWFSAIAVLIIMLPMVYWFSRRITHPIQEMRIIALSMSEGDFAVRANEQETGEMGDLARALNHLSGELSITISELTRERNQAVTIVNALAEGVLSVNMQGMPMMTNPALQTMLVAAGGGQPTPLPPEVWEEFKVAIQENRCADSTFLLGDMLLRLTVTPIYDPLTGGIGAIGVFHDETQTHQLEQTRREYVANVSHELRTPLTALRALIEPLCDGMVKDEEKRQELYHVILRETMRLSRLVDDMLELSRLQSGRLALEKIRFKIEPLLREVASTYAAKAADTGHRIMLNLPDEPLPTVLGNPDRTEQVLVSLMNNAFTYTPSGSSIMLSAEQHADCLHVTVEDDGPGINPADLPHVFDRFYKADKSHGGSTGTGLGLAISHEVMERLGERIFVENRPQGGARFTFTIHYS